MSACLDESGLYLSIGLVFIFSLSHAFISLLLLFLQHEHHHALAFIFVTRSFSLPEFSFFPFWVRVAVFSMASTRRWSCGALPSLAALGLVARRSSASPG